MSTRRFAFAVCVILAVHIQLVLYAIPPASVISGRPFRGADYQTHYAQTTTLTEGLHRFGEHWVYDPDLLAGTPVGLIFDVDNKLHFLVSYALHALGVPLPTAFNLFVVLSSLLVPVSLVAAARLLGHSRRAQIVALALGLLIWHFDSTTRFTWCAGMISWATVAHLALPIWALYYRMLKDHRSRFLYPLLLLLPLSLLIHVWAFGILAVPMVGLYVKERGRLDRRDHLRVWGLAAWSILVNLYWLLPALRHFSLFTPSGEVGQTNPLYILSEYLEIIVDPQNTGYVMPYTLWRVVATISALLALVGWRRSRDERFFYASLSLGWLFGMTYCAALIPGLRETEPFRFVMPFEMMAAVVGAGWLAEISRLSVLRSWPRPARAAVVVLLVLVFPRAVKPVLHFMPELRPSIPLPPMLIDPVNPEALGPEYSSGFLRFTTPVTWRTLPVDDTSMALAGFIRDACTEPGRVLVQRWEVGELLYWASGKPVIGGFPDRRMIHEAANLFRRPADPRYWGQAFADYLERYNIRYLVVTNPTPVIEKRSELLELMQTIGVHRVYRTRHAGGYFEHGSGEVRAGLNRIEVSRAEPRPGTAELTLRFHYLSTLRCQPDCVVSRAPVADDPAGFITVSGQPELPREFVIEHVY